jgi:hypothetical protein
MLRTPTLKILAIARISEHGPAASDPVKNLIVLT